MFSGSESPKSCFGKAQVVSNLFEKQLDMLPRPGVIHNLTRQGFSQVGYISAVAWTRRPDSMERLGFLLWATALGVSVSARMWCSVRLSAGGGVPPYLASFYVSAIGFLLAAACLAPFSRLRSFPRGPEPLLASFCMLPGALTIVASQFLGLGVTQMLLKLSTLSTALLVDSFGGDLRYGLAQRLGGTSLVLLGAGLGVWASDFTFDDGATNFCTLFVYAAGVWAAGAGFVIQAQFASPALPSGPGAPPVSEVETSTACAVQLGSAAVQLPLILCSSLLNPGLGSFQIHEQDVWLWLFAGTQTALYLRSMQIVPKKIGFSATFTLSLCGQMCSACLIDTYSGATAISNLKISGLGFVVIGAMVSGLASSDGGKREIDEMSSLVEL